MVENEMPNWTRCPGRQDAKADKMPRQTRCPDVKQDAQTSNKMPRCPERFLDAQQNQMPRQDAQMPRQTRCPGREDAQADKMPRRQTRCPDAQRDS